MARVNLESRFFGEARLRQLANYMEWSIRECVGTLALLWHESQNRLKTEATKKQIMLWTETDKNEIERLVDALCELEYLKRLDNGTFYICGNGDHVARLQMYTQRAKKGVRARKNRKTSHGSGTAGDTASPPKVNLNPKQVNQKPDQVNTVQFSSVQCSSDQFSANKEVSPGLAVPASPRTKNRYGPIEELTGLNEVVSATLENVTKNVQKKWILLYGQEGPEWIGREIVKAVTYLDGKPRKVPKSSRGWSAYLTGWLERGWDWGRRRKTTNDVNWDKVFEEKK